MLCIYGSTDCCEQETNNLNEFQPTECLCAELTIDISHPPTVLAAEYQKEKG